MGSTPVIYSAEGANPKELFNKIKEECQYLYGHDGYTGTMADCYLSGGYFAKNNESWTKAKEKQMISKLRDKLDNNSWEKGIVMIKDAGIVGYDVIEPTIKRIQAKPSYKMKFVVRDGFEVLGTKDTITDAINFLKTKAIAYPNAVVSKEYALVAGDNVMAEVNNVTKRYKTKPKNIANGKQCLEIHKYIFYGIAPS